MVGASRDLASSLHCGFTERYGEGRIRERKVQLCTVSSLLNLGPQLPAVECLERRDNVARNRIDAPCGDGGRVGCRGVVSALRELGFVCARRWGCSDANTCTVLQQTGRFVSWSPHRRV
jgi:hypothetical protein